jgi:hypothetical protein
MRISSKKKLEIKKQIFDQVIKPKEKELKTKINEAAYAYISELLLPHKKWISQAPEGFLYTTTSVYIQYGSTYQQRFYIVMDKDFILPYSYRKNGSPATIHVTDDKYKKIFTDLEKENMSLNKFSISLDEELNKVLGSCNSTKKLFEIFPEITNYVKFTDIEFYPPAVSADKLVSMLQNN